MSTTSPGDPGPQLEEPLVHQPGRHHDDGRLLTEGVPDQLDGIALPAERDPVVDGENSKAVNLDDRVHASQCVARLTSANSVRHAVPVNEAATEQPRRFRVNWVSAAAMITALAAWAAVVYDDHSATVQQAQVELDRQEHIVNGVNQAVDRMGQPGVEYVHVRIGGIHELERLATESPREQPKTVEKLVAFVRDGAARQGGKCSGDPVTQDVQAALTALGRRDPTRDGNAVIDLSHTCLTAANLEHADLSGAVLVGVDLRDARLTGAQLSQAKMEDAILVDADIPRANMYRATLIGADLRDAILQTVDLREALLTYADLAGARLDFADLRRVYAPGVIALDAQFFGARPRDREPGRSEPHQRQSRRREPAVRQPRSSRPPRDLGEWRGLPLSLSRRHDRRGDKRVRPGVGGLVVTSQSTGSGSRAVVRSHHRPSSGKTAGMKT